MFRSPLKSSLGIFYFLVEVTDFKITKKNCSVIFKLSNLKKKIKNFPEDDLIGDRNMSECFKYFKCFNTDLED